MYRKWKFLYVINVPEIAQACGKLESSIYFLNSIFFQSTFITVCDSQEAAKNTLSEYGPYLVSQVVKVSRFHWLFYLCQKVNGLPKVNRGHRKQLDEYQRFCEAGPKKSEDYLRTHGNYRKSPEVFVFVFTELNHVFSAFGAECMIFRQA